MAQWGKTDAASNSPFWAADLVNKKANSANRTAMFGNVTPSASVNNQTVGVFGVDTTEAAVIDGKIAHPGWVLVRQGTGPIATLTLNAAGSGYGNLAIGAIANGAANASFRVDSTNSTGGIDSITLLDGGRGFINLGSIQLVQPANGIYAVTIADGGRNYSVGDSIVFSNGVINAAATVASIKAGNGAVNTVTFTSGGRGFSNTVNTDRAVTSTVKKISQATINDGGTGYANTDTVTFSNGGVNATATVTTNSTGGITSLTFTACGNNFANATATVVTITTSGGSGANITPTVAAGSGANLVPTIATGSGATVAATLGGRAGRRSYETLVAMGSITSDGSDDSILPDS